MSSHPHQRQQSLSGRRVLLGAFLLTLGVLLVSLFAIAFSAASPGSGLQGLDHAGKQSTGYSRLREHGAPPKQANRHAAVLRCDDPGLHPADRPCCSSEEDIFAWWRPHAEVQRPRYTHDDLLIAMTCNHDRLALVMASRTWRNKVKTYILLDQPLNKTRAPPGLIAGMNTHMEYYDYFPEPQSGAWSQPGDARCAPLCRCCCYCCWCFVAS